MDRLILIKFPLKAKCITLITILLIYIFSIIYCIPYRLEQYYATLSPHIIEDHGRLFTSNFEQLIVKNFKKL
jgi:hypothetical protein